MTERFESSIPQEPSEEEQKIIQQYNLNNTEWLRYRLTGELPDREVVPIEQSSSGLKRMSIEEQNFLFEEEKRKVEKAKKAEGKINLVKQRPLVPSKDLLSSVWDKSREEADREHAEIMKRKVEGLISPELLSHFTYDEAQWLIESFLEIPSEDTQSGERAYSTKSIEKKYLNLISKEIANKKIIEIGDAGRKWNRNFFKDLGASGYIAIDTKYTNIDGLTFLMKQPDESVIVCSFGVFDDGSLYTFIDRESDKILKKYIKELCREIYRVTPQNSISLHGAEYTRDLIDAGFIEEVQISPTSHMGGAIRVFRKH